MLARIEVRKSYGMDFAAHIKWSASMHSLDMSAHRQARTKALQDKT